MLYFSITLNHEHGISIQLLKRYESFNIHTDRIHMFLLNVFSDIMIPAAIQWIFALYNTINLPFLFVAWKHFKVILNSWKSISDRFCVFPNENALSISARWLTNDRYKKKLLENTRINALTEKLNMNKLYK